MRGGFSASFLAGSLVLADTSCEVLRNEAEFSRSGSQISGSDPSESDVFSGSYSSGGGTHVAPYRFMMNEIILPLSEAQTSIGRLPGTVANHAYRWHALDAAAVARLLQVDPGQGLTAAEVITRRLTYGSNSSDSLASQRRNGLLLLLFLSIICGFLLTAAVLNRAVANRVEAFSILAGLAIMAIVGFGYLLKGAHELDAVQDATRSKVRVRRDRQETNVIAEELVPGDIIVLEAGDSVSADARLIEAEQLQVQESALSGESSDVAKTVSQVASDAPLEMRQSMVYLGTTISSGSGVAIVVATGLETEVGKIAARDN